MNFKMPFFKMIWAMSVVLVLYNHQVPAQNEKIDESFSFKLDRNKIILPVSVNGNRPLNVILDSGMPWAGLYLFHSEFIEEFNLDSRVQVTVGGAGSGDPSSGLQIQGNKLSIDEAVFGNQMIVVSRSSHTQTFPTDGVIGWTIFSHPVVSINYDCERIILTDNLPDMDERWTVIDIELNERHLPFFSMNVAVNPNDQAIPMTFYLDLASSENLEMLVKDEMKFDLPVSGEKSVLGTGLSGDFEGISGCIYQIEIAGYTIDNCSATFPDANSRTTQGSHTDGVIGAGFMKRFNTIYDFPNKKIYLHPSKYMYR